MEKVKIGRLLFHDKILSANRNIACATCHSHDLGGSDGLSLGIGEGGHGIGLSRTAGTGNCSDNHWATGIVLRQRFSIYT